MSARLNTLCASGSLLGLIAFSMAWVIVISATPTARISLWLILFTGPWLLVLRGVLRARANVLLYSSLLALVYLLHGGVVWWTDPIRSGWGLLEMLLALGHIISAGLTIRQTGS
ncbi:MAG: DUF2069 domain-containing protein [Pseudomonadota bacterium]